MTDTIAPPTDLIHEIGRKIVSDEQIRTHDWHSLSLVATVGGGNSMSGYVYDADGRAIPELPDDLSLFDDLERLHDVMLADNPTKRPWLAVLVQIRRSDGKLSVHFEYDDARRWKVTPTNFKTMPEELRLKD